MADVTDNREPLLAALLSFVIPGAGQVYNGNVGGGIAWFFGTIIGYILIVIPGLIAHGFCIYNAYTTAKARNELRQPALTGTPQPRSLQAARKIDVDQFIDQLRKLGQLHATGVLSDVEFRQRKEQLISDLGGRELHTSPEDFLLAVSSLKEVDVISEEDLSQVKSMVL